MPSNKHKATATSLVLDENGMVVGQVISHPQVHHSQVSYQPTHQHQPPQHMQNMRGGQMVMEDVQGGHYHGHKVMLDHNENEVPSGNHHYHRNSGSGGGVMMNGGGGGGGAASKDPTNWRSKGGRRRKDDDDQQQPRGLAAGVQRMYINTQPHGLNVTPLATGPYNPQSQQHHNHHHHHNNHHAQPPPVHHHHTKMPPTASPSQSHSSHGQGSTVPMAGGRGTVSTNIVLTTLAPHHPTAILTTNEPTTILVPVAMAPVENSGGGNSGSGGMRSRRGGGGGGEHSNYQGGGGGGSQLANGVAVVSGNITQGNQRTNSVQFDLAASAFPPLPGSSTLNAAQPPVAVETISVVAATPVTVVPSVNVANGKVAPAAAAVLTSTTVNAVVTPVRSERGVGDRPATDNNQSSGLCNGAEGGRPAEEVVVASGGGGWGDSLADVVKGTAKVATKSTPSNANGEWKDE